MLEKELVGLNKALVLAVTEVKVDKVVLVAVADLVVAVVQQKQEMKNIKITKGTGKLELLL